MTNKKVRWILWVGLFVALALYPKVFGIYYTNLFVTFAVFAIYSISFNLLLGYTALFSFGHAMFFGVGGYGTALALKHIAGLSLLGALGIGLVSAIVFALILCPIVVRVTGSASSKVPPRSRMVMPSATLAGSCLAARAALRAAGRLANGLSLVPDHWSFPLGET